VHYVQSALSYLVCALHMRGVEITDYQYIRVHLATHETNTIFFIDFILITTV
jgi:hypothetical protein